MGYGFGPSRKARQEGEGCGEFQDQPIRAKKKERKSDTHCQLTDLLRPRFSFFSFVPDCGHDLSRTQ